MPIAMLSDVFVDSRVSESRYESKPALEVQGYVKVQNPSTDYTDEADWMHITCVICG
jgi:hypothetical protein